MNNTATFVKRVTIYGGDQRLYKVSPPIPWEWSVLDMETGESETFKRETSFVLVSMLNMPYETGIFPCRETGEVLSMIDLASVRSKNIAAAFGRIGYELT